MIKMKGQIRWSMGNSPCTSSRYLHVMRKGKHKGLYDEEIWLLEMNQVYIRPFICLSVNTNVIGQCLLFPICAHHGAIMKSIFLIFAMSKELHNLLRLCPTYLKCRLCPYKVYNINEDVLLGKVCPNDLCDKM
jgi:hypothetical protein